jgi:hypothetical protein
MRTRRSVRFSVYYKVQWRDPRSAAWVDVQKAHPTAERVAVLDRPDGAHEVALPRQLHLDDVGAEVGEQRRGEGRADARPEIEHAETDEGTGGNRHRSHPRRSPREVSRGRRHPG